MDTHARRGFAAGTVVQLACMLVVAGLFDTAVVETFLSVAGAVGGGVTAALLVRDPAVRTWEDGAFYGGGAAGVATIAYFGVKSTYATAWIWHTRGTFAPVNVFVVQYLFGIWLVLIALVLGVVVGVLGFWVASTVSRRLEPRRTG